MEMLHHPIVLLWLTITFYWAVNLLRVRTGSMFVNPVVCTTAVVILYLKLAGIDTPPITMRRSLSISGSSRWWSGWPCRLYLNWDKIRRQWLPIVLSQAVGSVTGIVSAVYIAKFMGAGRDVVLSLAAKSVTNPIAIRNHPKHRRDSRHYRRHRYRAGMIGQMAGYRIMSAGTLTKPMSQGMSMGSASHAMGIAASLERGKKFAAYASLGLIFNGVLTAV